MEYSSELYHWGIRGMRWGVRRYQNEDGSLTEAGQKRYNKLQDKTNKSIEKIGKLQTKLVKQKGKYEQGITNLKRNANYFRAKESGILVSQRRADKLERKARRYDSLAARKQSRIDKTQASIDREYYNITKYNKKMNQLTTSTINTGKNAVKKILDT